MFSSQNSQVSLDANYIEDVFSTYLYTGNGSTQTITNGIDLSTKGGLVWTKNRSTLAGSGQSDHFLSTTSISSGGGAIDAPNSTNLTDAYLYPTSLYGGVSSFNTTGFTLSAGSFSSPAANHQNVSGTTYASWTFRKQPKFFDVVTYSGTGSAQTIAHNLGSVPGCIIIKSNSTTSNWAVYHRSIGNTGALALNSTATTDTSGGFWNDTSPTSTNFTVRSEGAVNFSGRTYVAYLFAHDAGGFGLTGTDNVISCGSYTGNGSTTGPVVNLGYEPQYVLIKNASAAGYWFCFDNMRGIATGGTDALLFPNVSDAEANSTDNIDLTSTGFQIKNSAGSINGNGNTLIYIAIRRGPMKVPTSGTSVFAPVLTTTNNTITTNFPVDLTIFKADKGTTSSNLVFDRLRGQTQRLVTSTTGAEATATAYTLFGNNTGTALTGFTAGLSGVDWAFRRAPSFFDEVCYTQSISTGTQTINHNLGVAPELVIIKTRSVADNWKVGSSLVSGYSDLNGVIAFSGTSPVNTLTSTTFGFNTGAHGYSIGTTYVSYLFATCAGVSKVGTYTGTGTTQQINCGFTAGARFVLIKRTDEDGGGVSGAWYVWDSARGIVSGNDPYLLMNSSAAEVTNTDYVDTYSAGFEISSTAPAAINASGGTFIFLAIA